ncbi:MAG TPA: hypothetical protein VJU79_08885 [Candidatus Dormibacteraeota bacterium]|nr:hypothetical protein [Candidatus Dormibacteraeota bacterium]
MYGSLVYQMDQRAQDRERRLAHKHWSDLAPKQRERRWTARLAAAFHSKSRLQAPPAPVSTKARFAA